MDFLVIVRPMLGIPTEIQHLSMQLVCIGPVNAVRITGKHV